MSKKRVSLSLAVALVAVAMAAPTGMVAAAGTTIAGFDVAPDCTANAHYGWTGFNGARTVTLSVFDSTANQTVASVTEPVAQLQFKAVTLSFTAVSGDAYALTGSLAHSNGGVITASQLSTGPYVLC